MNNRNDLPSAIRGRPFAVATAISLGIPRSRLRRRDLIAPFHGVRMSADETERTLRMQLESLQTRMSADQFFSHTTAALIHGLPLPPRLHDATAIHVGVPAPRRAVKLAGVTGHKLAIDPGSLIMSSGLRVPSPLEVWCELAACLHRDDLVAVGDALLRRVDPIATVDELERAIAGWTGRPGIKNLRSALELCRPRTDSAMETHLRLALVRAGLPEPEVNGAILDERGRFVAFGDLVYRDARVVVEYDGEHHRTEQLQYDRDSDRIYEIESLDWRVVRITGRHMRDHARVAVSRVAGALGRK